MALSAKWWEAEYGGCMRLNITLVPTCCKAMGDTPASDPAIGLLIGDGTGIAVPTFIPTRVFFHDLVFLSEPNATPNSISSSRVPGGTATTLPSASSVTSKMKSTSREVPLHIRRGQNYLPRCPHTPRTTRGSGTTHQESIKYPDLSNDPIHDDILQRAGLQVLVFRSSANVLQSYNLLRDTFLRHEALIRRRPNGERYSPASCPTYHIAIVPTPSWRGRRYGSGPPATCSNGRILM
ncbi:hypothetical protein BDV95DRAFT_588927 [Massariosphaeria phaeospora]|uniref:Uncharacterized protein n=1 Tax=Massariosphaeria phaeospora TaxID=100035 RepID=A0A7C8MGH0_9PLEO|nr:hypothetical protein BDV95DRAFT_588927 [Massariosphaeria phaeospora]